VTPATVQRADSLIRDDRRITTRELVSILGIGQGSVDKIILQVRIFKGLFPSGPSKPNRRA
jgi:hypothetical protein